MNQWDILQKIVAVTTRQYVQHESSCHIQLKACTILLLTLNLIVQTALKEIKAVQCKVKEIVELFKRSHLATEHLFSMQEKLSEPQLKQDV